MQSTERKTTKTRLLRPFVAVALTAGALLLVPAAEAITSDPIAIGTNFRRKAKCRGRGSRAGRHHPAEL